MSLARARSASRIITFTSLITGAWLASVRRSAIVSSSSARSTRSLPRRSVACASAGDSDCAERIAAWISAADALTSFARRPYVQHSSSITVGSGRSSAATSSSPVSLTPTGSRQCSTKYLGERRCASGPAAAARRSAPERGPAGSGPGTEEGTAIGSARLGLLTGRSRLSRRHGREQAVELAHRALQLVALALQQRVRLLVRKHDVRRQENCDLSALAGDAAILEQQPEQREVLEQGHAALNGLLRLADQPADDHRMARLYDRARFRFARRDDRSVLRRRHRLLRQGAYLLEQAAGDVAVVVYGWDYRELRTDVTELHDGVQLSGQAGERRRDERHLAADQNAGVFVVEGEDPRGGQHAHVRTGREGLEDGSHVDRCKRAKPDAETLQAPEERIAELLRANPARDPTRAVA